MKVILNSEKRKEDVVEVEKIKKEKMKLQQIMKKKQLKKVNKKENIIIKIII